MLMNSRTADFGEQDILYEDNHLIVVNKKPSEIVQGDKTGDMPLSETIRLFLKEKYHKPGNVFLGVTHRLDRPVSGAVLFAKTGKALARINERIRKRELHKVYWAVVKEPPSKNRGHLVHFLTKDQARNMSFAHASDGPGRQRAELDYQVLGKSDRYCLLEILLHTGRHHQIRVQLSQIGCPVKGDLKYGFDRPNKNGSIHLHAKTLSFLHPVKNEKITIHAPPPPDPLWEFFAANYG